MILCVNDAESLNMATDDLVEKIDRMVRENRRFIKIALSMEFLEVSRSAM